MLPRPATGSAASFHAGVKLRAVALLLSASSALWVVLGFLAITRLHIVTVTVVAAAVIVAVEVCALVFAMRVATWRIPNVFGHREHILDRKDRALAHLGWLAQFCQILGLLGTVAGFLLELRTLGSVHGSIDSGAAVALVGQMARGFGTALCSTFAGILASVAVSLAQHLLDD